ncbi:DUF2345 domain-containing protein [Yersinia canariae]|uniref:DUF2345 domain-containing protein n=1 Tax=Yersinia canariae TaxID=2607663 RepID=A0A857F4D6_9GAMM|nr:DUF2345 domain-containing protein [Yersinia canariae]
MWRFRRSTTPWHSSPSSRLITSSEDEIIITTPKTLTLNGGGSYLKLSQSGIEHGSSGDYIVKAPRYQVPMSGVSLNTEVPVFDKTSLELLPPETDSNMSR